MALAQSHRRVQTSHLRRQASCADICWDAGRKRSCRTCILAQNAGKAGDQDATPASPGDFPSILENSERFVRARLKSKVIDSIDYTFVTRTLVVHSTDGTRSTLMEVPSSKIMDLLLSHSPGEFYKYNIETFYRKETVVSRKRILSDYWSQFKVPLTVVLIMVGFLISISPILEWAWVKANTKVTHND
jgi:hypothetical protein